MDLKVLHVTSIKSRKPWKSFHWLGKEDKLPFVFDRERIGQIEFTSGKVKKKFQKVFNIRHNVISYSPSRNGEYVLVLLKDGNFVVWDKKKDDVLTVNGFSNFGLLKSQVSYYSLPRTFISNDGLNIVVIIGYNKIYHRESYNGIWSLIIPPIDIILPTTEHKEAEIQVAFTDQDLILGKSTIITFVFNTDDSLVISSSRLNTALSHSKQSSSWSCLKIRHLDLNGSFSPIRHRYAFLARHSHSSHLLAVAANQSNPFNTCLLFFDVLTEAVIVTDMKGCGAMEKSNYHDRSFWIVSLAWTFNDQFVIALTGQGSICTISRLGQILSISTSGCSMDKDANLFLNLHPLITVNSGIANQVHGENAISECTANDRMKQRFSIQTHPSKELIICSDGYVATMLQIPRDWINFEPYAKRLLRSAYSRLINAEKIAKLDITSAETPQTLISDTFTATQRFPNFNTASNSVLEATGSSADDSTVGILGDITYGQNVGKISFATDYKVAKSTQSDLRRCLDDMLAVWSLFVSSHNQWSKDYDRLMDLFFAAFRRFVLLVLKSESVGLELQHEISQANSNELKALDIMLKIILRMLVLLKFDGCHRNHMQASLRFVQLCLKTLLKFEKQAKNFSIEYFIKIIGFISNMEASINLSYRSSPLFSSSQFEYRKFIPPKIALHKCWRLLYNKCVRYAATVKKNTVSRSLIGDSLQIVSSVQRKLLTSGMEVDELALGKKDVIDEASVFYLNGNIDKAINIWLQYVEKQHVEIFKDECDKESLNTTLHSLLYSLLVEAQLNRLLELLDSIISRDVDIAETNGEITFNNSNVQMDRNFLLSIKCIEGLRFESIRAVLQSFSRFFALYFLGNELYVYPPHVALPLATLLPDSQSKNTSRKISIKRDMITNAINTENLNEVLTPDCIVELMILTGLFEEALWFVDSIKDWKSTLMLSVTSQHLNLANVPNHLKSHSILRSKLSEIFFDTDEDFPITDPALTDLILSSIFLEIDIVPEVLDTILENICGEVNILPLLVDNDIYLPAPPIFCQQVSSESKSDENRLRTLIFKNTKFIFQLLRCSLLDIPCATYLIKQSEQKWIEMKPQSSTSDINELVLRSMISSLEVCQYSGPSCLAFDDHFGEEIIQKLLQQFEQLCILHWKLHSRDMLCAHVRRFQTVLKEENKDKERQKIASEAFFWSAQLCSKPNEQMWTSDLHHLILTLASHASFSISIIRTLAKCVWRHENTPFDIEKRVDEFLLFCDDNYAIPSSFANFKEVFMSMTDKAEESFEDQTSHIINSHYIFKISDNVEVEYFEFISLFIEIGITKEHEKMEKDPAGPCTNCLPLLTLFASSHKENHLQQHQSIPRQSLQLNKSSMYMSRSKSQGNLTTHDRSPRRLKSHGDLTNSGLEDANHQNRKQVKFNQFSKVVAKGGPKRWISSFEFQSQSMQNNAADVNLNESYSLPALNNLTNNLSLPPSLARSTSFFRMKDCRESLLPCVDVPIGHLGQDFSEIVALLSWIDRSDWKIHQRSSFTPAKNFNFKFKINVPVSKILMAFWLIKNYFDKGVVGLDKTISSSTETITEVPQAESSGSCSTLVTITEDRNTPPLVLCSIKPEILPEDGVPQQDIPSVDADSMPSLEEDLHEPPLATQVAEAKENQTYVNKRPDMPIECGNPLPEEVRLEPIPSIQVANDNQSYVKTSEFLTFAEQQQKNFEFLMSTLTASNSEPNNASATKSSLKRVYNSSSIKPKSVKIHLGHEVTRISSVSDENDVSHISHSSSEGLVIRQSAEKEDSPPNEDDLIANVSQILSQITSENATNLSLTATEIDADQNSPQNTLSNLSSSPVANDIYIENQPSLNPIDIPLLHFDPSSLTRNHRPPSTDENQLERLMQNVRSNHDRFFKPIKPQDQTWNLLRLPPQLNKKTVTCPAPEYKVPTLIRPELIITQQQKIRDNHSAIAEPEPPLLDIKMDSKLCQDSRHSKARIKRRVQQIERPLLSASDACSQTLGNDKLEKDTQTSPSEPSSVISKPKTVDKEVSTDPLPQESVEKAETVDVAVGIDVSGVPNEENIASTRDSTVVDVFENVTSEPDGLKQDTTFNDQFVQTDNVISPHPDRLTHHLLSSQNISEDENMVSIPVEDEKLSSMRNKLNFLEGISHDLLHDFKSSKMLLRTIETLNSDDILDIDSSPLITFNPEISPFESQIIEHKMINDESRSSKNEDEILHISGLSGLSDIFGELVANSEVANEINKLLGKDSRNAIKTSSKSVDGTFKQNTVKTSKVEKLHNQRKTVQKQNFEQRKQEALEMIFDFSRDINQKHKTHNHKKPSKSPSVKTKLPDKTLKTCMFNSTYRIEHKTTPSRLAQSHASIKPPWR